MNRTLVILKPDAVERGLIGEILGRFECRGLRVAAAELRIVSEDVAKLHYLEHKERPFFGDLVAFITRSAALVMVVEGPTDTWKIVRTMIGTTNPADAAPGTIRGDYATDLAENLIHGSDGPEAAVREVALFFPGLA